MNIDDFLRKNAPAVPDPAPGHEKAMMRRYYGTSRYKFPLAVAAAVVLAAIAGLFIVQTKQDKTQANIELVAYLDAIVSEASQDQDDIDSDADPLLEDYLGLAEQVAVSPSYK